MNVKDFIKFLDQFPEDTVVRVAIQREAPAWQAYGRVDFEDFIDVHYEHYEYTDFTNNKFVKEGHPFFNMKILDLGSER